MKGKDLFNYCVFLINSTVAFNPAPFTYTIMVCYKLQYLYTVLF